MDACFCCVRFSFFHTKPRDGLGNVSKMTFFCVEWDVKPELKSIKLFALLQLCYCCTVLVVTVVLHQMYRVKQDSAIGHCESKKGATTLAHNLAKCWQISKNCFPS